MTATTTNRGYRKPTGPDAANLATLVGDTADDVDADVQAHLSNHSNPHVVTAAQTGAVATTAVGVASGVASLDSGARVPKAQLPTLDIDDGNLSGTLNSAKDVWVQRQVANLTLPAASACFPAVRSRIISNLSGGTITLSPTAGDTLQNGTAAITLGNGDTYNATPISASRWLLS